MSAAVVHHSDLLRRFGLAYNPFVDRTAETCGPLDEISLFVPSDLRDWHPNPSTYVFFGRRGSGKTTIRMMMQEGYAQTNASARLEGRSRGFFVADLTRPSHLTARLKAFQAAIRAPEDAWDAAFADSWTLSDFVDSIISYVVTNLASEMGDHANVEGADMVARAAKDPRVARQLLVLAQLYADCDAGTLTTLRAALLRRGIPRSTLIAGGGVAAATVAMTGGVVALSGGPGESALGHALTASGDRVWDAVDAAVPWVAEHPRLVTTALAVGAGGATWAILRSRRRRSLHRAMQVRAPVRVVAQRSVFELAKLLDATFSSGDSAATVAALSIGVSPQQKLERLTALLRTLGYDGLAIFGDGFDEVGLLDPVAYPSAIKAFAKEACRSDLLNQGRVHLFFPETRLALDLSTDKTLKEARFDRHHVRDLTWSRHQLEALAERRFVSSQLEYQRRTAAAVGSHGANSPPRGAAADAAVAAALSGNGGRPATFADLFKNVKSEDLSSFLSKLSTPRELMIMMSETFSRLEAHPDTGISGQDVEIATQKALEQAV